MEVRTEGEAVSEFGKRLSRLVLTRRQLELMDRAPPRVCLTGPPGVGKTVMLVLMGLQWLLEGHDVRVVSTRPASLAASRVAFYQLDMTMKAYTGTSAAAKTAAAVHFHQFDFYQEAEVERAIVDLTAEASREGHLHVLMEEAVFSDRCDSCESGFLSLWSVCCYRHAGGEESVFRITLKHIFFTRFALNETVERKLYLGYCSYSIMSLLLLW